VKPHCGRCEWLTKFGNCGAMLQGLIEKDGVKVGHGALVAVTSPRWAERCQVFVDVGYARRDVPPELWSKV